MVLLFLRAVLILMSVVMAVIAIVVLVTEAHPAIAPGFAHLFGCWLVPVGEARA